MNTLLLFVKILDGLEEVNRVFNFLNRFYVKTNEDIFYFDEIILFGFIDEYSQLPASCPSC